MKTGWSYFRWRMSAWIAGMGGIFIFAWTGIGKEGGTLNPLILIFGLVLLVGGGYYFIRGLKD